jgi:cholesterol transport system auxiliary component
VDLYRLPVHQAAGSATPELVAAPEQTPGQRSPGRAAHRGDSPGRRDQQLQGRALERSGPVLLRNRLLDGFQRDGRVQRLSADDSNLQADYELGGELQAFQSEYRPAGGGGGDPLRRAAGAGRSQRILASKRFEMRQPLADKQVPRGRRLRRGQRPAGAPGDDWTVSQAAQAQAKNQ